jgi:sulfide:quinone oxidoreductase
MAGRRPATVVIAGGGVAAFEAALALRALAEEHVRVELLAPEPYFWYRPLAVAQPFALGDAKRFDLAALAALAGAGLTRGALVAVDARRHLARTTTGDEVPYDLLLVAAGATATTAVPGALTFGGPPDVSKLTRLLDEVDEREVTRIAFAVPWGAVWSLPLYELALLTAEHLAGRALRDVRLDLVTPEHEPLELFGHTASRAVRGLLEERAIRVHTTCRPRGFVDGELRLVPDGRIPADRVVALPRLRGARIHGLPQTEECFVPVDPHGRVEGVEDVFAAGDITTFPVRQGGIAAQQALAAAEAIAAAAGAAVTPEPFRPVLRGLLLTGSRPRYLRRDGERSLVGEEPLWWPPAKIVGRHLAPFLAGLTYAEHVAEPAPAAGAIAVEVEL